jgi:hypothetical protein
LAPRRNENSLRVSLFILPRLGIMPPCDLHIAGRDQGSRRKQMSEPVRHPGRDAGGIVERAQDWDVEGNPAHMAHAKRAYALASIAQGLRLAICDQGAKPTWEDLQGHWLTAAHAVERASESMDEKVFWANLNFAADELLSLCSHIEAMRRAVR